MDQMSLLFTLCELECELHQPKCRGDRERLEQLLAPDFREFGRSGAIYTRNDTLAMLPLETEAQQIHAQDFAVHELADLIVLLYSDTLNVAETH
ncbi:MAG TPA: nuclear transport factor 2 family protein [Leptolyngbyaceae cyanobacterium M33_DOE_097]|uniref:Nuclear transport factor 2 family protein n=1 Tax=Oscillatoriales cyanobacterium SpSt-418 TaxID=2282169 RepID=A0A7C3PE84_9CYAN|nr:nuclear transport factor 2 family protein [Leptolyngbyaceae cyanobacterium M33_DOE_097]